MQSIQPTSGDAPVTSSYQTNPNKGPTDMRVHREWASRPADQRFLTLSELENQTRDWYEQSFEARTQANKLRLIAQHDDPNKMDIEVPDRGVARITHWSFGQLCGLGEPSAPATYVRKLPAFLAALNVQHGLMYRGDEVKIYARKNGDAELRAVTGPDYGRVPDYQIVQAIRRFSGEGPTARWKVPGMLQSGGYNPFVDVTKETTTLYASDRDMFLFLVDDLHPIEIAPGDLVFRGFYMWNSEVGSRSLGISTFYLRGVCCNRILWGVENRQEIVMRHSKYLPDAFLGKVMPALEDYTNSSDRTLLSGIAAARDAVIAKTDDEAKEFLMKKADFSKAMAGTIFETHLREEGKPIRSVWDIAMGVTAAARANPNADTRLDLEKQARKLLDSVTSTKTIEVQAE